jgi:Trk K+ transport system NAD-binding subunit
VQITEVFLSEDHPYVGKTLKEIQLPQDVFVGSIIRDNLPLFTSAHTTIQPNDSIVLYSNHQKGTQNILEMMFLSTEHLLT